MALLSAVQLCCCLCPSPYGRHTTARERPSPQGVGALRELEAFQDATHYAADVGDTLTATTEKLHQVAADHAAKRKHRSRESEGVRPRSG